jgi:hypothetical protein
MVSNLLARKETTELRRNHEPDVIAINAKIMADARGKGGVWI